MRPAAICAEDSSQLKNSLFDVYSFLPWIASHGSCGAKDNYQHVYSPAEWAKEMKISKNTFQPFQIGIAQ